MNRMHHRTDFQPQLVAERKPLRPIHVAATRQPVKITKPFSLEGELIEAGTPRATCARKLGEQRRLPTGVKKDDRVPGA